MLVVDIGMVAQDLKMDNIVYGFSYKYRNSTYFYVYSDVNISLDIFVLIVL